MDCSEVLAGRPICYYSTGIIPVSHEINVRVNHWHQVLDYRSVDTSPNTNRIPFIKLGYPHSRFNGIGSFMNLHLNIFRFFYKGNPVVAKSDYCCLLRYRGKNLTDELLPLPPSKKSFFYHASLEYPKKPAASNLNREFMDSMGRHPNGRSIILYSYP